MQKRATILLVEDNPADVALARESFEQEHFDASIAVVGDGVEATAYLEQRPGFERSVRPSLILLDLNLPRMGGLEFLAWIKQRAELRSIPVIVLTSSVRPRDLDQAYDLGANCYIAKPVDFTGFETVARLIGQFWLGVVQLPPTQHNLS